MLLDLIAPPSINREYAVHPISFNGRRFFPGRAKEEEKLWSYRGKLNFPEATQKIMPLSSLRIKH